MSVCMNAALSVRLGTLGTMIRPGIRTGSGGEETMMEDCRGMSKTRSSR